MSYSLFLLLFLLAPISIFGAAAIMTRRNSSPLFDTRSLPVRRTLFTLVVVAVLYTTPWDNYLVATRVWWYDPQLVLGLTLGWVPIEEYTFFVLQTTLVILWLLVLARRLKTAGQTDAPSVPVRSIALLITLTLWLFSVVLLVSGWQPGTYLALELVWALPALAVQFAFGADILWRYRRYVLLSIVPLTLFLSAADFLAIGYGTWTINPDKSLGLLILDVLPLEELLFFLLTNSLVTFGATLLWAPESRRRILDIRSRKLRPLARYVK